MFWYRKADNELSFASSMVRFKFSLTGCWAKVDVATKFTNTKTNICVILNEVKNLYTFTQLPFRSFALLRMTLLSIILCFFMLTINKPINQRNNKQTDECTQQHRTNHGNCQWLLKFRAHIRRKEQRNHSHDGGQ